MSISALPVFGTASAGVALRTIKKTAAREALDLSNLLIENNPVTPDFVLPRMT
jgi:hypothetical protein